MLGEELAAVRRVSAIRARLLRVVKNWRFLFCSAQGVWTMPLMPLRAP